MHKALPAKHLPQIPTFPKLAIKLVSGLLSLFFFLNYQPALGFPPVRKITQVKADTLPDQTQIIKAQTAPIQFQLPHPGYISTFFSSFHPGVDLATGLGMPIRPIYKGIVSSTGYNLWGLGLNVEVDHQNGYKSLYAHMGKIYVKAGQKVEMDTLLGEVGLTGNTTGPHTHLQVTFADHLINPLQILPEVRTFPITQDFATPSAQLTNS